MEYEIVKWYDERRTVTRIQGFESAVSEYNKALEIQWYDNTTCAEGMLGETCTISLTSHSCLATNKQILLKDEIKQIKLRIEHNGY